jgi:hypothetical protein
MADVGQHFQGSTPRASGLLRSIAWRSLVLAGLLLGAAAPAVAQVVQLPTFQSIGYSGTVWVPDSGAAFLGGLNQRRSAVASRGPLLPNFSASQIVEAGGMVVKVDVVDPRALDRELKIDSHQAARHRGAPHRMADLRGERDRTTAGPSVSDLSTPPDDRLAKGKWLVRRARAALDDRLPQVARIYYLQALPLLPPELQALAQAELNRVSVVKPTRFKLPMVLQPE